MLNCAEINPFLHHNSHGNSVHTVDSVDLFLALKSDGFETDDDFWR